MASVSTTSLVLEKHPNLAPGLYLVATPIGTVRDITLRALDVIQHADILAAEDTRTARKLMAIYEIALSGRQLVSYHDGNGARQRPALLSELNAGRRVCLICEAGSPLIADPGHKLVREAMAAGVAIHVVPGPCAAIAALSISGLPTDRFLFAGFLPTKPQARARRLEELADIQATLIFFESARRLTDSLRAICEILGGSRPTVVCREMTKKFEEVWQGHADELAARAAAETPKGEIVILVDRTPVEYSRVALEQDLTDLMSRLTFREAVEAAVHLHGARKRDIYRLALRMRGDKPARS